MPTFIFPTNPEWYDAVNAFKNLKGNQVDWGTNLKNISKGDKVLIYYSEPKKEINIISEVVKILEQGDSIIDDSGYIKNGCPRGISNPLGKIIRLKLKKIIEPGAGLDLRSFRKICKYRGCFIKDFCVNNSKNIKFKDYLNEKLDKI